MTETDAGKGLLQIFQKRIRAGRKRISLIVYTEKVAAPAGNGQRDIFQFFGLIAIGFDSNTIADAYFLRRVRSNALRRIGDIGVGQPFFQQFIDECLRIEDAGINDDGQPFIITDFSMSPLSWGSPISSEIFT